MIAHGLKWLLMFISVLATILRPFIYAFVHTKVTLQRSVNLALAVFFG